MLSQGEMFVSIEGFGVGNDGLFIDTYSLQMTQSSSPPQRVKSYQASRSFILLNKLLVLA